MSFASGQDFHSNSYPNTDAIPIMFPSLKHNEYISGAEQKAAPLKRLLIDNLPSSKHAMLLSEEEEYYKGTLQELERAPLQARLPFLPFLRMCVQHSSENLRKGAIDILGRLEDHTPLDALMTALNDPSWEVRIRAAMAFGNYPVQLPLPSLTHVLIHETDMSVREALVIALGKHPQQLPTNFIVSLLLEDTNWLVRQAAIWALSQLGKNAPKEPLLQTLQRDEDKSVRASAAKALIHLDERDVSRALYDALAQDEDEEVREAAAWALQQFDEEIETNKQIADHSSLFTELPATLAEFWDVAPKEHAFSALTQFIADKQGCVSQSRKIDNQNEQTLFINCIFQQAEQTLQEIVFSVLRKKTAITPLESAIREQDNIVRDIVLQAIQERQSRHWNDFFVLSFTFASLHPDTSKSMQYRIILSGMECTQVRKEDTAVANQIVDVFSETLPQILFHQERPSLENFKVWHQLDFEQFMEQCATYH